MALRLLLGIALALAVGCTESGDTDGQAGSDPTELPSQARIQVEGYGEIVIRFLPDKAPGHVSNFARLAREGVYDGTIFHRVIPGFMIQGGDPLSKDDDPSNDGTGDAGYKIKAEFSDVPHKRGIVSMARGGHPDSAGTQFFIVVKDSPFLDGQYSVFGEVIEGLEVADAIVKQPRDSRDRPLENVVMTRVTVE